MRSKTGRRGSLRYGRPLCGLCAFRLVRLLQYFIHADMDARIRRIASKYGKSDKEAKDMIIKTDKSRASYYNYYTNKKWGSAKDYNLCIDSGKLGLDNAAKLIINAVQILMNPRKIG